MPLCLPTSHPAFKGKLQGAQGPKASAPPHPIWMSSQMSAWKSMTSSKIHLQQGQRSNRELT